MNTHESYERNKKEIKSPSEKIPKHKFKLFDKVLVRDSSDDKWIATFFCHYCYYNGKEYSTGTNWKQCIPYKGNEHLIGTTDNPE